jgi:hypothetical protein
MYWEGFPRKALAAAFDAYGLGADPGDPRLFLDDSRFMGRRRGILLTSSDVCGRDGDSDARRIPLSRVETVEACGKTLVINGRPFVKMRLADALAVATAAKFISAFAFFGKTKPGRPSRVGYVADEEDELLNGLDFILAGVRKVSVRPSIDPERLGHAIASYARGVAGGEVLLLADNAVRGMAREGLMATRHWVFASGKGGPPVTEILGREGISVEASGSRVIMAGAVISDLNRLDRDGVMAVARALGYLSECASGKKPW